MSFFVWLFSKLVEFFHIYQHRNPTSVFAIENDSDKEQNDCRQRVASFDSDYASAIRIMRSKIDRKFPDGHYARMRLGMDEPGEHDEDRAWIVNTTSTVIATALREGATVHQAVAAGAASVGI